MSSNILLRTRQLLIVLIVLQVSDAIWIPAFYLLVFLNPFHGDKTELSEVTR